jgi:hypothetical protein
MQRLYSVKKDSKILMNGKLERIWKEAVMAYCNVLSWHLPEQKLRKAIKNVFSQEM